MRRKLLFLQTEDWTFWSHRLSLARAAKAAGYEVVVALNIDAHGERLRAEGFRLIPLDWKRSNVNPFHEMRMLLAIIRLYSRERPDIVHQVAVKPILYGSLAARLCGLPAVANTLTGLGFVFVTDGFKARILRAAIRFAFKLALKTPNSTIIFQNADDQEMFISRGLVPRGQTALIRGSGVDTGHFVPHPEPAGVPLVILPARMLWSKGVREFVEAARTLRAAGVKARFALVGDPDFNNRAAIPASLLASGRPRASSNAGAIAKTCWPCTRSRISSACRPITKASRRP